MKSLLTAFLLALGLVFYLVPNRAETLVGATDDDGAKNSATVSDSSTTSALSSSANKADATPHFWQRDSRGGFANGGRDYCARSLFPTRSFISRSMGFPR